MNHLEAKITIIGSGLAGYMLAKELRKLDKTLAIRIITSNQGDFYSKPLLSTALTSNKSAEDLCVSNRQQMAESLDAEIHAHCLVTRIDPEQRLVYCGERCFAYQDLILALGADNLRVPIINNTEQDIPSVNHLDEYAAFRDTIANKKRVAVIGAGLVGCEFANDMVNVGYAVSLIAPCATPLPQLLIPEVGEHVKQVLEQRGLKWHLGRQVDCIDTHPEGFQITLDSGEQFSVEAVLSAVGLTPNTQLAQQAGLKVARGIMVNDFCQSSDQHIFALGDCAEVMGHSLQYVAPLLQCSRALAKTLCGTPTPVTYPIMPIQIKTPACPIAIVNPANPDAGHWTIEQQEEGVKALFHDADGNLQGYILTQAYTKEKIALSKLIPITSLG